jgi:nucleoside diphosphate kinase
MRTYKAFILAIILVINLQLIGLMHTEKALAANVADSNFCARIQAMSFDNSAKLEKGRSIHKKHGGYSNMPEAKLGKVRGDYDKKRSEHYDALNKKFTSPENQQAIAKFQQAVQSATEVRRNSIDSVRADFRSKITALMVGHRDEVDQAENEFITSINQAYANAKTSCGDSGDTGSVKSQLILDIKIAKEKFSLAKAGLQNDTEINNLIVERDSKLKEAYETFKATLEQAKKELVAQLKTK